MKAEANHPADALYFASCGACDEELSSYDCIALLDQLVAHVIEQHPELS